MNAELPLATRVLMGVSVALREFWVLVAAAGGGVGVACWRLLASPGRRPLLDRTLLRMPLVGALASKFAASQLARTLATLLGGGIPLVSALDIAARSIGNRHVAAPVGERVPRGSRGAGPGRLDGGEGSISPGGRAHGGGR